MRLVKVIVVALVALLISSMEL
ncbi:MAG: hypothetical protein QOD36_2359, partial [Mycobacterium sp.]|nr:hypothetical protein [Mycobacterium sp.]